MLGVLSALFVTSVLCFFVYRRHKTHYFKKHGLPGPEPHWFFGNLKELWDSKQKHLLFHNWSKKYGKFYGFMEGPIPVLVTSSPEAVEQICVKQYSNFQGHKLAPLQPHPIDDEADDVVFIPNILFEWGKKWKRLRMLSSAAFSTGKLKGYLGFVKSAQDQLLKLFSEKATTGEDIDIQDLLQRFTIEIIGDIVFGVELNGIEERDGNVKPQLKAVRNLIQLHQEQDISIYIFEAFPEVANLMKSLIRLQARTIGGGPFANVTFLFDSTRQVIETRLANPSLRRNDLLQSLIDATIPDESGSTKNQDKLSTSEVVGQGVILFVAGTETTSTALSWASYLLATHQDIQEKLFDEISILFPRNGDTNTSVDYDHLMSLKYLDNVCNEVLRLYPIAFSVVNRFVLEDTNVCGVDIPKDIGNVLIDVYTIHQDPDFWGPVDPKEFYPDRFDENYPTFNRPNAAFIPFGYGPRICLGMRLAYLEMKMLLANMLYRFKIEEPRNGFPPDGVEMESAVVISPKNLKVRLSPRK